MRRVRSVVMLAAFVLMHLVSATAQEIIKLPAPKTEGGMPLMQALKERKSGREFSSQKLPLPVLSDLLWAAWGINRPDGHHTAPSARNAQEIDVYVAMSDGLFLYEPKQHQLQKIAAEDLRAATGTNDYVKDAALNLVYVADPDQSRSEGSRRHCILFGRRYFFPSSKRLSLLCFGRAPGSGSGKH